MEKKSIKNLIIKICKIYNKLKINEKNNSETKN